MTGFYPDSMPDFWERVYREAGVVPPWERVWRDGVDVTDHPELWPASRLPKLGAAGTTKAPRSTSE